MKCLNRNVLIGLAVLAGVVLLLKPSWMLAALPLLILAACPLSMILMMRNMSGQSANGGTCDTNRSAATSAKAEEELNREIRSLQEDLRAVKADTAHRTATATTNN